jgi:phosphatidylinositol glycan class W
LDYQEHASEYGIHWNFYTTVSIMTIMLVFVRQSKYCLVYAFLIMLSYEFVLKEYDLAKFVFHAPRTDFISGNREGICSIVGYFSMQLIGIGCGNFIYKDMLTEAELKEMMTGKREIAGKQRYD